ncbi:hypothetical protein F5Y17DRAFT_404997 [Xylariaceae sp. FL0594]|nr:hypothetical protein F5Y17DRAFT_404997 [Xylariaceae sp. FL0594]
MADQCIVCLDNLDVQAQATSPSPHPSPALEIPIHIQSMPNPTTAISPSSIHTDDNSGNGISNTGDTRNASNANSENDTATSATLSGSPRTEDDKKVAVIEICGHALHDLCLREWTAKANSCPICRQTFHLVHVYDKVGGTLLSSYKVEDKKQVAEFDPQAWMDTQVDEEEDSRPCPICNEADHDDLLLLCDNCDAPYHTYCVGLDAVPRGHWFCMECSDSASQSQADEQDESHVATSGPAGSLVGRSDYLPRTQASMRRARRRARSDAWQGAWGQIAGRVFDALNIDLDNHEDDETLHDYRRSQQQSERERREYQRWQQRLSIASRLGARDVFAQNLPITLPQRIAREPAPQPAPVKETSEERRAWGALEKAMESEAPNQAGLAHSGSSSHRKRKSRSVTASPVEPPPQPERKLKRPRTRRVPTQTEASSSSHSAAQTGQPARSRPTVNGTAHPPVSNSDEPSFLSALLREVEMSPTSDDENIRALFATGMVKPTTDAQSPASSPSPSAHSSPRASSMTPPPRGINDRPGSPLSLSSRIEPIYPPANYALVRENGEHSDSETRPRQQQHQPHVQRHIAQHESPTIALEIRQPKPRRQGHVAFDNGLVRPMDASPSRINLPYEIKESISGIVKDALKPHWKSGVITADQYANINRDLSHRLYREVSEPDLDERARSRFEQIATKEVARAVSELKS